MTVCGDVIEAIGNTPLIRLNRLSDETGCEIFGKAEFMNPSGSVKDRAAKGIILDAEARGNLKPGYTVVEGTAGNTGIGLAWVCNARGYRLVIVIPETQSKEKIDLLRSLGADVRPVPAVPYSDPDNYQKIAGRLADETTNAFWANQFGNTANRQIHYETTGPEIWKDMDGRIDAFVSASGTGGTIGGVSRYLKEMDSSIRVVLADCTGSATYSFVKNGTVEMIGENSISEGIGNSRITENFSGSPIDDAYMIDNRECLDMVYRLIGEEGLFLGGSAAINVAATLRTAADLGPGHRLVTLLCDGADRYLSRLFNSEWLAQRGLKVPAWRSSNKT